MLILKVYSGQFIKETECFYVFKSCFSILFFTWKTIVGSICYNFLKEWIFTKIQNAVVESVAKNCVHWRVKCYMKCYFLCSFTVQDSHRSELSMLKKDRQIQESELSGPLRKKD